MAALYVDGLAEIPSVAPRLPSPEAPYIYIVPFMESGPQSHNMDGLLGLNSIMLLYMEPLGRLDISKKDGPFIRNLFSKERHKCRAHLHPLVNRCRVARRKRPILIREARAC